MLPTQTLSKTTPSLVRFRSESSSPRKLNRPLGLTTDVSLGILDQAEAILVATDLDGRDAESAKLREHFLRRQLYVCGYSLRHFFTMHGYLEKELTHLRMEIDQDAEMADDESCAGAVRALFCFD
jgi:hypothetical protein